MTGFIVVIQPPGFPAVTVPMGFVCGTLPAGLQILGRPWSEPTLIEIDYAYKRATGYRRPSGERAAARGSA